MRAIMQAKQSVMRTGLMMRTLSHCLPVLFSRSAYVQAGIAKLHIEGRIRITFDPLVDKLPVIGAVKVGARATWKDLSHKSCGSSGQLVLYTFVPSRVLGWYCSSCHSSAYLGTAHIARHSTAQHSTAQHITAQHSTATNVHRRSNTK